MLDLLKDETYVSNLEVDITPEYPLNLVGFNREDNLSRGILHRLYSQIIIFRNNNDIFCIISIDNTGLTIDDSEKIRKYIANILDTNIMNIMLCFTHTHSAPNTEKLYKEGRQYYEFLKRQICIGVTVANSKFVKCKAVWGFTTSDIGINRRNPKGIVDNRIGILKVTNADTDEPIVILLRLTAHGNVLVEDNYLISSDYFGITRDKLKEQYKCDVIITQGASGNIKPMYQGTINDIEKMSDTICKSLNGYIDKMKTQKIESIKIYSIFPKFLTADTPSLEKAKQIVNSAQRECNIDGKLWLEKIQNLLNNNIKNQEVDLEIQFFQLNNGILCGIPVEPFCEIAIDVSKIVENKFVFFGGYTNGCNGYFPTYEEHLIGGYEVYWSYLIYGLMFDQLMPLKAETANTIVDIISNELNK